MSFRDVDLEKQPFVKATELSPTVTSSPKSALFVYQTLVGDVTATSDPSDDSLYHEVTARERKVKIWFMLSGLAFGFCILAQIILCLGIAIGAQIGLDNDQISILAAVNTGVAATIAVLKGLGLPDKLAVERRKLQKIAERIRFTTRMLKAGLTVDAEKEAKDLEKMQEECEDEAHVSQVIGSASAAVPTPGGAGKNE